MIQTIYLECDPSIWWPVAVSIKQYPCNGVHDFKVHLLLFKIWTLQKWSPAVVKKKIRVHHGIPNISLLEDYSLFFGELYCCGPHDSFQKHAWHFG